MTVSVQTKENPDAVGANPSPRAQAASCAGAVRRPWLVADIGGTNARFGYIPAAAGPVQHVQTLACADHDSPAAAAQAYLSQLAAQLGAQYQQPGAAAFAVATAVAGDRVAFTNNGWAFSSAQTQAQLGLHALRVLNDFEALALSLPHLGPHQLRAIPGMSPAGNTVAPDASGLARAVIGPGTGLGVAGIVHTASGWVALPGEGGHATLAAANEQEAAVLAVVRRSFPQVSAERLLSGIGLPELHKALGVVMGQVVSANLDARDIVQQGVAGLDPLCSQTLDMFCALLGSFAGNVALTLGARGGVYIGGGIVPRLGERFFASAFRARFEAKGRFQPYLQAVPTWLITDTLAALTGAASALES